MEKTMRIIAYYLPQFHAIPENDGWWGKGFTEWTNVKAARPLFRGHHQPVYPDELGYYNLMDAHIRERQAELAQEAGIEGFCYWHYWFGGKQLLEKPLQEVISSAQPDFPFCLGWANESWKSKIWGDSSGQQDTTLIEQTYPEGDTQAHFEAILPILKDKRYILVDGKPLLVIYRPFQLPHVQSTLQEWRRLAEQNGLKGLHIVGHTLYSQDIQAILDMGFDAVNVFRLGDCKRNKKLMLRHLKSLIGFALHQTPLVYDYQRSLPVWLGKENEQEQVYPCIVPRWDHTPRSGKNGFVLHNSTPGLFKQHVQQIKTSISMKQPEHQIVFLKSWNEWGEGNYVEPDQQYKNAYLQAIKDVIYDID